MQRKNIGDDGASDNTRITRSESQIPSLLLLTYLIGGYLQLTDEK